MKKAFNNGFTCGAIGMFLLCSVLLLIHTVFIRADVIQLKKCTHLTEMQAVSKYLSYCIYVDSMQYCKKKDRVRLADSILKYQIKY